MQTLKTENTRKLLAECRPEIGDPQWALDAFVEITKMCDAAEQPTPASDVDCPKCKEWRDIALMQSERLADGKFTEVKVPCVDCEMRKLNPAGDVGEALEALQSSAYGINIRDADEIDACVATIRAALTAQSVNGQMLEALKVMKPVEPSDLDRYSAPESVQRYIESLESIIRLYEVAAAEKAQGEG